MLIIVEVDEEQLCPIKVTSDACGTKVRWISPSLPVMLMLKSERE
jgi:hypothetical protein